MPDIEMARPAESLKGKAMYMVCWFARQLPWVQEDGPDDLMPDPREDHDMWFGPFADAKAAGAFARRLRTTDSHAGYQVGMVYPPEQAEAWGNVKAPPASKQKKPPSSP